MVPTDVALHTAKMGEGIASRLRRARDASELTIAELAHKAHTSAQTLHNIMLGSGNRSRVGLLVDIARALGVRPAWLILGEGPQHEPESPSAAILDAFGQLPDVEREHLLACLCKPVKR